MRRLFSTCLLVFLPAAMAGELECATKCRFDDASAAVKWKPSACVKPPAPVFDSSMQSGYNASVDAFNGWLPKIQAYVTCVNGEASADMKKAGQVVSDGVSRVIDDTNAEMARAKAALDRQRPMR